MPDTNSSEASQSMQRVRVAMTGLAAVILLIGVASAVFNYASDEPPVTAIGAAKPDVVANMTTGPVANVTANEPLAELGVAPSAPPAADVNTVEGQPR
ncbi:hypothetical protein [Sphingomonas sp.]|uniref:hypothetical protein n=1 Tax=Sphingomonas sp. TaxID=28214 RepID=UPI002DD63646|nr:hypothetical protein [Sphingomonas sp.]